MAGPGPTGGGGRLMHPVAGLFGYHRWASDRLLDFCAGLPDTAPAEHPDVYGGIRPLFNHIVRSETGYLRLITGELPRDPVSADRLLPVAQLKEQLRWLAGRWRAAVEEERDVEAVQPVQRGDDPEWMADWVPFAQCLHHGDDHRTQISMVLGRQGVEAPPIDVWTFGPVAPAAPAACTWWNALLDRLIGHHLWATRCLLEHCHRLSGEQLQFGVPGTYGLIAATLDHLVSADRSYLSRLEGGPRTGDLGYDTGQLLEEWVRLRDRWLTYLASDRDFETVFPTRLGSAPAWVFVALAIQHGNEHRTHTGTALLAHGLGSPEIDMWGYAVGEGALKFLG